MLCFKILSLLRKPKKNSTVLLKMYFSLTITMRLEKKKKEDSLT